MFERRVKIFLLIIVLLTGVLLMRAAQVQLLEHKTWNQEAEDIMTAGELIETSRGRLLDVHGLTLAEDAPCIDACVDYRAITDPPLESWVREVAIFRLRGRVDSEYRSLAKPQREDRIKEEIPNVLADIQSMWRKLAQLGGIPMEQMDATRSSIKRRVEMRRKIAWHAKYEKELKRQKGDGPPPWYQVWLMDDSQTAPELDDFYIEVGEQVQPHVILPAIANSVNLELGKNLHQYPGLVLRQSVHRVYPFNDLAAHVIGHLSKVSAVDVARVKNDPAFKDELFGYLPNDLIGRTGLEALCEPLLRGRRGKIQRVFSDTPREERQNEPMAGADVKTTIDIELQSDIQRIFSAVQFKASNALTWTDTLAMPGAAVVIDVPTNQVRALVSYPSFDLNKLDSLYSELANDSINRPLYNRATQFALEPGSTVKPMVGLAAISQGLFGLNDTVECTGYLQLSGRVYRTEGRCWVATMYGDRGDDFIRHHPFPVPHPTGHLNFPDALERSCNVFFETLADRLGVEGLRYWYDQFGLGRPTGIGIVEARGNLPGDRPIPAYRRRAAAWFSGIGQDQLLATPIQMANVAATIARDGVWMKPKLLVNDPIPTSQPDRVQLKLSPEALREAREGMVRTVNGSSGTGTVLHREDMIVAGKTGSAQAAPLTIPARDEHGQIIYSKVPREKDGQVVMVDKMKMEQVRMGTHENRNLQVLWYRGSGDLEDRRSHAWFIGFAPAENPQIAFAVMVEYGGGGGATAGFVANKLITACVEHGTLKLR